MLGGWSLGLLPSNPNQVSAEVFRRVQRFICDFQELPENSTLPQAAIPGGLTAAVLASSNRRQRLFLWHSESRLPSPDWPDNL